MESPTDLGASIPIRNEEAFTNPSPMLRVVYLPLDCKDRIKTREPGGGGGEYPKILHIHNKERKNFAAAAKYSRKAGKKAEGGDFDGEE